MPHVTEINLMKIVVKRNFWPCVNYRNLFSGLMCYILLGIGVSDVSEGRHDSACNRYDWWRCCRCISEFYRTAYTEE